jgi:hypothetical protein
MPFTYFSSGLSLQNNGSPVTGVSTLNFVNGELGVAGNVASFTAPALVLTQGGVTVTSPTSVTLAGTAELTQNATSPSIVQVSPVSEAHGPPCVVTFNQTPKIGNLILLFSTGTGARYPYGAPSSVLYNLGFDSLTQDGDGLNCYYKTSAGESDISVTVSNGDRVTCYLVEIENQGEISHTSGQPEAAIPAGDFLFPSFNAQSNSIIFTLSYSRTQSSYTSPLPAGSEILLSYIDTNSWDTLLIFSPANDETQVGVTSSVANNVGYGQISIAPNAANISATITT